MRNRIFYLIVWIILSQQTFAQNTTELPLQHGIPITEEFNVADYWISEKLDGVRGYWDGKQLFTRQGNLIHTPTWFTKNWPLTALDGELWSQRNSFQDIVSCVKRKNINEQCWQHLRFMVFDLPDNKDNFTARIQAMKNLLLHSPSPFLAMIKQYRLSTNKALYDELNKVVADNGEGLMLHHQHAFYLRGRNKGLMKLKQYQDAEAKVIQHFNGKGKYQNMLGAMLVENEQGIQFKIGSGFSDEQRKDPAPIGSIITYKYVGKTQRGVPRFASFLRIKQ